MTQLKVANNNRLRSNLIFFVRAYFFLHCNYYKFKNDINKEKKINKWAGRFQVIKIQFAWMQTVIFLILFYVIFG